MSLDEVPPQTWSVPSASVSEQESHQNGASLQGRLGAELSLQWSCRFFKGACIQPTLAYVKDYKKQLVYMLNDNAIIISYEQLLVM